MIHFHLRRKKNKTLNKSIELIVFPTFQLCAFVQIKTEKYLIENGFAAIAQKKQM